jgi:hypothetical protein
MGNATAWYWGVGLLLTAWSARFDPSALACVHQMPKQGQAAQVVRAHAERANVDPLTLPTFVGLNGNEGGVIIKFTEYTFSRLTEAEARQLVETVKDRPEHPGRSALRMYEAERMARARGLPGVGDTVAVMILDNRRWAVTSKGYFNDSQSAAMGGKRASGGWRHVRKDFGGTVSMFPPFVGDDAAMLRDRLGSEANYFRGKIRDLMFAGFTAPFMKLEDIEIKDDKKFKVTYKKEAKDVLKSLRVVLRGEVSMDGQVVTEEMVMYQGSGSDEKVIQRLRFSDYKPAMPMGSLVPHVIETFEEPALDRKLRELRLESVTPIGLERAEMLLAAPSVGQAREDLLGDSMVTSQTFDFATGVAQAVGKDGKLGKVNQEGAINPGASMVGQARTDWSRILAVVLALPALVAVVFIVRKHFSKGS